MVISRKTSEWSTSTLEAPSKCSTKRETTAALKVWIAMAHAVITSMSNSIMVSSWNSSRHKIGSTCKRPIRTRMRIVNPLGKFWNRWKMHRRFTRSSKQPDSIWIPIQTTWTTRSNRMRTLAQMRQARPQAGQPGWTTPYLRCPIRGTGVIQEVENRAFAINKASAKHCRTTRSKVRK